MTDNKTKKAEEHQYLSQADLDDIFMAGMSTDDEVFADTPGEALAAKSVITQDSDTIIDQAELEALLAALGDDEILSDEPPKPAVKKEPAAPKEDKVLSQEDIDAMLAALGG